MPFSTKEIKLLHPLSWIRDEFGHVSCLLISMQVFQKGSPLAADVSKAILMISEQRILKGLEQKWFPLSTECSAGENDELSLGNFWALYLLCGATSTLCFLLFFFRLLIVFNRHQASRSDANPGDGSVWMKAVQLVHFFHNGPTEISNDRQSNLSLRSTRSDEWISPWWDSTVSNPDHAAETPEVTSPTVTVNPRVNPFDAPEPPATIHTR